MWLSDFMQVMPASVDEQVGSKQHTTNVLILPINGFDSNFKLQHA
jgi:hypothetical protein